MDSPGPEATHLEGDPGAVEQLAAQLRRTALTVRGASDNLAAVGRGGSVWEGPVAHGFLDHVGELARRLDRTEEELRDADASLRSWQEGIEERRARLGRLQDDYRALPPPGAEEPGSGAEDMRAQLQAEMEQLREEHEREAARAAALLNRAAQALSAAAALDVTAWVAEAEARIRELDEHIGSWVDSQGGPLSEAVSTMGQTTALSSTVSQAAGVATPGVAAALGAAVTAVAASAPGSHRLLASARKKYEPVPVDALPEATFARGRRGESTGSDDGGSIR